MRTETDDETMTISLDLDTAPEALDLTNGLGDQIIDEAIEGMLAAVAAKRDPASGKPWPKLSWKTISQKGHADIGSRTGEMLTDAHWRDGTRIIQPRSLSWTWVGPIYGRYFHAGNDTGQPPRQLIGWTREALEFAEDVIAEACTQLEGA